MHPTLKFIKDLGVFVFAIIACIIILNVPNVTGLSDNGDFIRVTSPNSIDFINKDEAKYYFQQYYKMDINEDDFCEEILDLLREDFYQDIEYDSSQFGFVKFAKILNYISNTIAKDDLETFNIKFLAAQYIIIFAAGFWLFYKAFENDSIIQSLLIFIICSVVFLDLGYIIYFNSFYGEGLQYCTFMFSAGVLVYITQAYRKKMQLYGIHYIMLFFFFWNTYIFAGSKSSNVPFGIVLALTGILISLLCTKNKAKIFFTITGILCIIGSCIYLTKIPTWMTNVTNYNAVFYGILKNSKTPADDLFDMDINQRYISLSNTNAYNGEYKYDIYSEQFDTNVYESITKGKILKFYLLHPSRFFEKVNISLTNATSIKPLYLGNYTKEDSSNYLTQNNHFLIWSNLRAKLGITNIGFFIGFTGICLAILLIFYIRFFKVTLNNPLKNATYLYSSPILSIITYTAFFICLIAALIIPFMANGEADLQKHMFLFNNIYDMLIVCVLCTIINKIWDIGAYFKKHIIQKSALIAIIITAILAPSVWAYARSTYSVKEITFGNYNNTPIEWEVIDETNDSYLLISKVPLLLEPFDGSNTNYWKDSSLRKTLNTTFYNSFSTEEKEKIILSETPILLAQDHMHVKESGVLPYYWNPFPHLQDKDISRYYKNTSKDYVFLLNVYEYNDLILKNNIAPKLNMVFITPYANNTHMVRYIADNGLIYINEATNLYNIYPCIRIKK